MKKFSAFVIILLGTFSILFGIASISAKYAKQIVISDLLNLSIKVPDASTETETEPVEPPPYTVYFHTSDESGNDKIDETLTLNLYYDTQFTFPDAPQEGTFLGWSKDGFCLPVGATAEDDKRYAGETAKISDYLSSTSTNKELHFYDIYNEDRILFQLDKKTQHATPKVAYFYITKTSNYETDIVYKDANEKLNIQGASAYWNQTVDYYTIAYEYLDGTIEYYQVVFNVHRGLYYLYVPMCTNYTDANSVTYNYSGYVIDKNNYASAYRRNSDNELILAKPVKGVAGDTELFLGLELGHSHYSKDQDCKCDRCGLTKHNKNSSCVCSVCGVTSHNYNGLLDNTCDDCGYDKSGSSGGGGCVAEGTLVTLADGSQKPIEEVTYEDTLLVWDFFNGTYAKVPSVVIVNHGYSDWKNVELTFDDATSLNIITAHALFDVDENRFVLIDSENAADYIGHSFLKVDGDGYTTVTLESTHVSVKRIASYSLVSGVHYNFVVENMFSLTNRIDRLLQGLEVGENLTYDAEQLQADIEAYGLYTYEDFADYITYEQFVAFNGAYLKISVGKGYITYEEIVDLIQTYIPS